MFMCATGFETTDKATYLLLSSNILDGDISLWSYWRTQYVVYIVVTKSLDPLFYIPARNEQTNKQTDKNQIFFVTQNMKALKDGI